MPREAAGAGFIYGSQSFVIPFPPGTGQVNAVLSLPVTKMTVIGAKIIASAVAAGGGASRTFNIRRGSATGTVVATATVVLADLDALGEVKDIPAVSGVGDFEDGDTLTIEWAAAGAVAFTGGSFIVEVRTRRRIQQKN